MTRSAKAANTKVTFVEPMECLAVSQLPEGQDWSYEIKLDGYRLQAVRTGTEVQLYSRKRNLLNRKFPYIAAALEYLPPGSVVDGELVALGSDGRPSFNLLQKFRAAESRIQYLAFDLLYLRGRDLRGLRLSYRRELLRSIVKPSTHLGISEFVLTTAEEIISRVKEQQLEGIVAKRIDGVYESSQRTGSWSKMRINRGQEFVVGGYIPGNTGFESVAIGFWRDGDLIYSHRLKNGFVPTTRCELAAKFNGLKIRRCPFSNLPQNGASRWGGEGFNTEKMKEAVWLKPKIVVQVEFVEWAGDDHLRHAKFVGIRDDKDPKTIVREEMNAEES